MRFSRREQNNVNMIGTDRLCVQGIDPEIIAAFKKLVRKKHGKLHGALAQEVEIALRVILEIESQNPELAGRLRIPKHEPPSPYQ